MMTSLFAESGGEKEEAEEWMAKLKEVGGTVELE